MHLIKAVDVYRGEIAAIVKTAEHAQGAVHQIQSVLPQSVAKLSGAEAHQSMQAAIESAQRAQLHIRNALSTIQTFGRNTVDARDAVAVLRRGDSAADDAIRFLQEGIQSGKIDIPAAHESLGNIATAAHTARKAENSIGNSMLNVDAMWKAARSPKTQNIAPTNGLPDQPIRLSIPPIQMSDSIARPLVTPARAEVRPTVSSPLSMTPPSIFGSQSSGLLSPGSGAASGLLG